MHWRFKKCIVKKQTQEWKKICRLQRRIHNMMLLSAFSKGPGKHKFLQRLGHHTVSLTSAFLLDRYTVEFKTEM